MAKYRVIKPSYIGRFIDPEAMPPGDCIVDYDGEPSDNLIPIKGKTAKGETTETNDQPA